MKSTFRWIGAFTLPALAVFVLSYIGLVLASSSMPTPWHDPADGVDGLSLLGNSLLSGILYSLLTFKLAPKAKPCIMILMVALAVVVLAYGAITLFSAIGKFGVLRYAIMAAGMIGTTIHLAKK